MKYNFRVFRATGSDKDPFEETLFVFVHGAGHSSLSWALLAKILKENKQNVLAYDMRGHGETFFTESEQESETNLSMDTLCQDAIDLLSTIFPEKIPPIFLCGHSLGGAIVANIARARDQPVNDKWERVVKSLKAVAVVDIVEGTAKESLPHMDQLLQNRPTEFPSLEVAIRWSFRSKLVLNLSSARISIPPQLRLNKETGKYEWRTNLLKSKPFWDGWFDDLSKKFLSCRASRLLVLAGTDRLDTELTIAQMQGKYQLIMLPSVGHTIQEDAPETLFNALQIFKQRFAP